MAGTLRDVDEERGRRSGQCGCRPEELATSTGGVAEAVSGDPRQGERSACCQDHDDPGSCLGRVLLAIDHGAEHSMPDRQRGDHHERYADFARVGLADSESGLRGDCTGDCCCGRGADQPPRRLTYRRRTHPARPAGERANREEGGKHAEEGGVLRGGAIQLTATTPPRIAPAATLLTMIKAISRSSDATSGTTARMIAMTATPTVIAIQAARREPRRYESAQASTATTAPSPTAVGPLLIQRSTSDGEATMAQSRRTGLVRASAASIPDRSAATVVRIARRSSGIGPTYRGAATSVVGGVSAGNQMSVRTSAATSAPAVIAPCSAQRMKKRSTCVSRSSTEFRLVVSILRPTARVRRHRVGQCRDAFAGQCAELGFEDHGLVPRPHHVVVIAAPVESAVDPAGEFFARTGIEYVVEILEYGEGAGYDGVRAERLEDVDLSGKVQVEGGSAATTRPAMSSTVTAAYPRSVKSAPAASTRSARVRCFCFSRSVSLPEVSVINQDPSAAGALTGQLHETRRLSLDSPLVKATLWCSAHSTDQRTP